MIHSVPLEERYNGAIMNRFFLIFLIIFLTPFFVLADENVTVLEVTGTGISRSKAIQNGLIEALKQAKGVKIDSRKSYIKLIQDISRSKDGENEHDVGIDKLSHSRVKELTKGTINEYRIINATKNADGGWEVTLAVKMLRYKTPGISPHSRRKLAVMPFRAVKKSFSVQGGRIPAWEISRELTQKVVTELTQSRRFTVLDREYICEYFHEKNLLLSGDTPLEEQMRLGEVLGVDYMLVGTITELNIKRTSYQITTLGKTGYRDQVTLLADYRIIVMPTRQIKWADSVSLTLENKALHQLAGISDPNAIRQAALAKAAQMLAHKALANIYPIRVSSVQPDGRLIFNQGGVTVSEGELFDIFQVGEKVIDPYSGESLGAAETWVAAAKVERVLAKHSYARVIKGKADQIQVKAICRRVKKQKTGPKKTAQKIAIPW